MLFPEEIPMKKRNISILALLLALSLLLSACLPVATPTEGTKATNPTLPSAPAKEHLDDDGDEICDHCGIDVTVELDFYAFNDLHGVFSDTAENPGVDELTTFLKNAYADEASYEILLSSGDMWQGSVESSSNKGQLMTQWMNHMGFVSMTLGNHEFDWGSDYIAQNAQIAEFPFLGINVTDENVDRPYCQPSVVIERGGVKIGIIGAVGDVLSSVSGEFSSGINFAVRTELTKLVKEEAARLRSEGCHLIIYSIHDGYNNSYNEVEDLKTNLGYYDLDLSEGYVDLVFEGHSHRNYVIRDKHGVYHLQGGGDNDGITHATAKVNSVTGTVIVTTAEYMPTSRYQSFEDDPIVKQLGEKYADQLAAGNEMLGYNAQKRYSEQILQKVADLYLAYGQQRWGEQYDIVLGGGFLSARSPYDLDKGEVYYSDLQMILPFDNQIQLCSIKGSELLSKFIYTNNSRYYISLSDYGTDIKNSIDKNATYYIITDTYCSSYAPNRLTVIDTYDQTTFARDLIADYIKDGNWS
jgi:2',3'-cyclic-nucleotide 2'-phosphodiesterase (5'-nucleotidase family)